MSKKSKPKKVVVTTTQKKDKVKPTVSRLKGKTKAHTPAVELALGKSNYMWMLIGIGLMAVGYLLMLGGHMPSDDVWDDNIIYSFTRVTLAPVFILAGLAVEVYAIFKK